MTTYERVTYRPEGSTRARRVFLRDPHLTANGRLLVGIEVDREGDEVAPKGFDQRQHVIEVSLVSSRVPHVMDRHYGWLVPAGQES